MDLFLRAIKKIIPAPLLRPLAPAYHFTLAFLGAVRYGFPSRRLTVIGVTGTNGKSTVAHLLHELFYSSGFRVGSISSLRFKINDSEEENRLKMTMPGRFRAQKFLSDARRAGCRFVIIEVTSEGIKQFRHRFIRFHSAVLTNITPEHLESHGGFEQYRNAKMELFKALAPSGFAVLNQDDASADAISGQTSAGLVWYSHEAVELKRLGHPVRILGIERERVRFMIDETLFDIPLGGDFNLMNSLAAIACVWAYGISPEAAAVRLHLIAPVAGRMEYIQREPFAAVVDYAHTPDALEKVYSALGKNLIAVLGSAGGGRDKWKRREIGRIAANFCKEAIITSEDPDDEDPQAIADEIRSGIPDKTSAAIKVIIDRREAIRTALRDARSGDTVIITGMGAQPWFIVRGGKIPWDERAIVREELSKISNERF